MWRRERADNCKEEKKARKAAVKAERAERRVAKKEMRGFFKEEAASQKRTGGESSGLSVFTY